MRMGRFLVVAGATLAICLGVAASASAATQVGDPCTANVNASEPIPIVAFPIIAPASPFPTAVPASGVITSWGVNVGTAALAPGASVLVTLKVVRPNLGAKTLQVVGESSGATVVGTNTFNVRIPVQAGDAVGVADTGGTLLACEEASPGASIGLVEGNPVTGGTVPFIVNPEEKSQLPIFATVEPDADGDGYGDETQDKCPTAASTHDACPAPTTPNSPAPPPPIALSDTAAAKKGLVTVTLTSSAQATVTVGGNVKVGKGKTVKLSGGTQIVAPGTLAKFTIVFPAKLKAALKELPTSKKLSLTLTMSAPGATTKALTVKVPGELKPVRKHHHGK